MLVALISLAAAPASTLKEKNKMVKLKVFNLNGELTSVETPFVEKSDLEWRAILTPEQYRISRNKGTEPAFCGGLLNNKEPGVYVCICCGLPLFDSGAKFESGSGWPSFFEPIAPQNVVRKPDHSLNMERTEILCARCGAHLGHVFDDGPPPTLDRHCLNSESLKFVARTQLKTIYEKTPTYTSAVLAGGCFWCVEAVFEPLEGIIDVESGYSGGAKETANYEAVCAGNTGHAECVKIIYDPARISFEQILKVHFETHDPTTLNRQGSDVGTQYRSAIFYADEKQKASAAKIIDELTKSKSFKGRIVTTLEPLKVFYPAEAYHQDFVCKNPRQAYVESVALPKVEKTRQKFWNLLRK